MCSCCPHVIAIRCAKCFCSPAKVVEHTFSRLRGRSQSMTGLEAAQRMSGIGSDADTSTQDTKTTVHTSTSSNGLQFMLPSGGSSLDSRASSARTTPSHTPPASNNHNTKLSKKRNSVTSLTSAIAAKINPRRSALPLAKSHSVSVPSTLSAKPIPAASATATSSTVSMPSAFTVPSTAHMSVASYSSLSESREEKVPSTNGVGVGGRATAPPFARPKSSLPHLTSLDSDEDPTLAFSSGGLNCLRVPASPPRCETLNMMIWTCMGVFSSSLFDTYVSKTKHALVWGF